MVCRIRWQGQEKWTKQQEQNRFEGLLLPFFMHENVGKEVLWVLFLNVKSLLSNKVKTLANCHAKIWITGPRITSIWVLKKS